MSLALGHATEFRLHYPTLRRRTVPSRHHHRPWKRRRIKLLSVRSHLEPTPSPFDNLFQSLLSLFPSTNTINYVAPALGLASGVALYLSSKPPKLLPSSKNSENSDYGFDVGEWILFTSPTPFNRFVILRCPSMYAPENELLEDLNGNVVKEGSHFVKLNSGRMIQSIKSGPGIQEKMVYQRICVGTEDGGVVSLDWPENLDLEEERGLDTTVMIVPGTTEGSSDWKIRGFVSECLRRGIFPIVMNPRGCAGSPLTTARLFTVADSDDISTAIQFINKKRPWTTLMGVGWGYGANILTKYLAESGERTPVTAAICINNPFDLAEAARSSFNHLDFDQKHTSGLISILQANKELFQGQGKRFDVKKALSASNIQDFDKAISMVCHRFDTIEDFYAKSSTRDMVGKLKIPVLFIQNDDETAQVNSIPRSLIAGNPYTSLLLCSNSPYRKIMDDTLTFYWEQNLIIEWLEAVELGLLKGRHPLLKDVDFAINPSKGLALLEDGTSDRSGRADKLFNFPNAQFTNSSSKMVEVNGMDAIRRRYMQGGESLLPKSKEMENVDDEVLHQSSGIIDANAMEEGINSFDIDRGQILQSAEVVMNMIDITMPNTLSNEQKKNVLSAVDQGETLIKALEDAVPEDVRGKLASAVSEILQSHKSDLRFEKLLHLRHLPDVASGLNSKVLEKVGPSKAKSDEAFQFPDQRKKSNEVDDGSVKVDHNSGKVFRDVEKPLSTDGDGEVPFSDKQRSNALDDGSAEVDQSSSKLPQGAELDYQLVENLQISNDEALCQSTSDLVRNSYDLEKVNSQNVEQSPENKEVSHEENCPERNYNNEQSGFLEGPSGMEDTVIDQKKEEDFSQPHQMESNKDYKHDLSSDKSTIYEVCQAEGKSSDLSSTSEAPMKENEAEVNQKNEEKTAQSAPRQNSGPPPSFSVSDALNALTGFDDSTQVAVNSVFNVIEDMIDQFEVEKENGKSKNESDGRDMESKSDDYLKNNNAQKSEITNVSGNSRMESGISDGILLHDHAGSGDRDEQKIYPAGGNNSHNSDAINMPGFGSDTSLNTAAKNSAREVISTFYGSSELFPSYLTSFFNGDPLYREYLKKYLDLKMRSLDVDKTSALYLNYIPEEGKWKLLEQEDSGISTDECSTREDGGSKIIPVERQSRSEKAKDIIEPSYVIFDSGRPQEVNQEIVEANTVNDKDDSILVKNLILECLNTEVSRRSSAVDNEAEDKLARDVEQVANVVAMAVKSEKSQWSAGRDSHTDNLLSLDGDNIIKAILFAVEETQYLRKVLPIGVIVGTSLAALRKFFNVVSLDGSTEKRSSGEDLAHAAAVNGSSERLLRKNENKAEFGSYKGENEDKINLENSKKHDVMVGAVTAALGASAFIAHRQNTETNGISSEPFKEKENYQPLQLEEMPEKSHDNVVASLAEKALAVASPMVPTKDGKLDHDRLVAVLTELGQKGGILKLVGKVALLWGGIRGAMSLTDKLISFLNMGERPVIQRILGFVFMVLLLWSPVVVPLLPTIVQSWGTRSPLKFIEFACIFGLYASIAIMIALWGKRIRKYDDPLLQYGLDLASIPKIQNFVKGVIGGATLVLLIHSVNSALGCVHLCWPASLSSTSEPLALMKSYGRMLLLIGQGIVTATGVSAVEELLLRSWLPDEISADLGYHRGIIISGLVFAISQRSTWEIPGLFLLSLSFAGVRQRCKGSLSIPIGLRTGMLASNYILRMGGFLTYQANFPVWVTGGHAFQPFGGVVGFTFCLVLAIILYPREPLRSWKTTRVIRD